MCSVANGSLRREIRLGSASPVRSVPAIDIPDVAPVPTYCVGNRWGSGPGIDSGTKVLEGMFFPLRMIAACRKVLDLQAERR